MKLLAILLLTTICHSEPYYFTMAQSLIDREHPSIIVAGEKAFLGFQQDAWEEKVVLQFYVILKDERGTLHGLDVWGESMMVVADPWWGIGEDEMRGVTLEWVMEMRK